MADPRKGILTIKQHTPQYEKFYDLMIASTAVMARQMQCTSCSVVISGSGLWAVELSELDGAAAARFYHALSIIVDPHKSPARKARAELKRAEAAKQLLHALDLKMAPAVGKPH